MSQEISVQRIFAKLAERFNADNAADLAAVFQFALEDADSFYLDIRQQRLDAVWGDHADPDITLRLNEETLAKVVMGELDGMSAFMKGQLRAEGNVMLATRLGKLFKR